MDLAVGWNWFTGGETSSKKGGRVQARSSVSEEDQRREDASWKRSSCIVMMQSGKRAIRSTWAKKGLIFLEFLSEFEEVIFNFWLDQSDTTQNLGPIWMLWFWETVLSTNFSFIIGDVQNNCLKKEVKSGVSKTPKKTRTFAMQCGFQN